MEEKEIGSRARLDNLGLNKGIFHDQRTTHTGTGVVSIVVRKSFLFYIRKIKCNSVGIDDLDLLYLSKIY